MKRRHSVPKWAWQKAWSRSSWAPSEERRQQLDLPALDRAMVGALIDDLDAAELPKRREIVAYCRGPYCVYADDAVRLLRSKGLKARRLDIGFPEWNRAGLPVEIAS